MKRFELNEQEMENVAGGKFSFYQDDNNNWKCKITDHGVYETDANGFFEYIRMRNENPGLSEDEYFDLAINDYGFIW